MAGQVDVEHDQYFLKHLVQETGYPGIGEIIKQVLDVAAAQKAVDFKENVVRAINECLQVQGVPMFRTRYITPYPPGIVLMVCYGSRGKMRGVWFKNTGAENLNLLSAKKNGYRVMLSRYGRYALPSSLAPAPAGAISIPGERFTGQAIVSEPIDDLKFYLSGMEVAYEMFEKAWLREFGKPVPDKPGNFRGKMHTFTIGVAAPGISKVMTPLEASLKPIEAYLREALADEEKAVPFYETLLNGVRETRSLIPRDEMEMERYMFTTEKGIEAILFEQTKHRDKIKNLIIAVQELRKTLERERTTGKTQVLQPLERL